MSKKVTLADGTRVGRHYDFNGHFPALRVHDQASDPTCYYQTHAALGEAFFRMYAGEAVRIDPRRMGQANVDGSVTARRFIAGRREWVEDYSGKQLWNEPEFAGLSRREAVMKALWLNGVIEGGVACRNSFNRLWRRPDLYPQWRQPAHRPGRFTSLPVLHTLDGDLSNVDHMVNGSGVGWTHSVIFVGYDWDLGLIPQNSWGPEFGLRGRAYLEWAMLDNGCVDAAFVRTFNDRPANGLKMQPARAA